MLRLEGYEFNLFHNLGFISSEISKSAVFWDVALCRSCVKQRLGGTYCLHLQGRKLRERGTGVSKWLQPPAHAGSSLADFSTLTTEAIRSSKTSVHTRSTRRHIPEDGTLQIICLITWKNWWEWILIISLLRTRKHQHYMYIKINEVRNIVQKASGKCTRFHYSFYSHM
jgi:hypothetical protein